MKNKISYRSFACLIVLAIGLTLLPLQGCQDQADSAKKETPSAQGTASWQDSISCLVPSDQEDPQNELDGTFTTCIGAWDLVQGRFSLDAQPAVTMTGEGRIDNLLSWNGKDRCIVFDSKAASSQESISVLGYYDSLKQGERMIWGDGYEIKLTEDFQCTVTQGETAVSFTLPETDLSAHGKKVALENLMWLGGEVQGDQCTLVFAYLDIASGEENWMLLANANLQTKAVQWEEPVAVPEEYRDGFFLCASLDRPLLNHKLYFSAWDSIAYYDLKEKRFVTLASLPEQTAKLLPQAVRATFNGRPVSAEIEGCTKDTVVGSISYVEDNGAVTHEAYFAVQGDQVGGFLVWSTQKDASWITVYGPDLKQTDRVETPTSDFAPRWQKVISPVPF